MRARRDSLKPDSALDDAARVACFKAELANLAMASGHPGELDSWKAHTQISVRLGGSVISLRDVYSRKADIPISVRLGGSVISLKDVHL